jgi:hypothetical protein
VREVNSVSSQSDRGMAGEKESKRGVT